MAKICLFCVIVSFAFIQDCYADGEIERIGYGMTTKAVIELIGAPNDKIDRETKREQLWLYPRGSIVFINRKVASVNISGSNQNILTAVSQKPVTPAANIISNEDGSPVEDIISEILKEVPSDGSDASPGSAVPGEMRPVDISQ